MKSLETSFQLDNNQFTQVKRNEKAALYKRETLEGAFVSYEVFAIKTKNDQEIYPNKIAMSKWAWCPIAENRANIWFDRLTAGEVVIPQVDPETGDVLETSNISTETETPVVVVETPVVETPVVVEDPTAPTVVIPEVEIPVVEIPVNVVQPTPDGGAVVTVATVKKNKVTSALKLPSGEWTRTDFAILNGLKPKNSESYGALMREIKLGRVKELRKEKGKGKPHSVYSGVVV
jgi:hypothetical protein